MKKQEMVKSKDDFNNIIKKGKRVSNKYYIICSSPDDGIKFGIAVGKKIGNAVVRNKLKRQTRVIIDNNKSLFKNSGKYIIILKKEILDLSFKEKENEFKKIMVRI